MNSEFSFIVSMTVAVVTAIIGISAYHINDRILMAKNIDNAIAKGIDPIAVRCSYAKENDVVCVAFAASGKEVVLQSNYSKK